MKKILKGVSILIIVVFASFLVVNVFADDKPKVKKYLRLSNASAVLYTDNNLYLWGSGSDRSNQNIVIENVKNIITTNVNNRYNEDLLIVDLENNLKIISKDYFYNEETEESIDFYSLENVIDTTVTDIKLIDKNHILTTDNKLYKYNYIYHQYPSSDSVDIEFKQTLIAENVKEWSWNSSSESYLILDFDNNLYAYGANIYGKKINDGNDITEEPILIAENVKYFSNGGLNSSDDRLNGNFYLTYDNELYFMSNYLAYPKLIKNNVTKFLYNNYYIKNGQTYYLSYSIKENEIIIYQDYFVLSDELEIKSTNWNSYFLSKNGNLYNSNYDKIMPNVKRITFSDSNNIYALKENGELIHIYDLANGSKPKLYKKMSKVKEIINSETYIMEDDTIFVSGANANYDIANFNGQGSSNYKNYSIIKGIPNVPENISVSQVILNNVDKTDFVVGDSYDFYAYVYPSNAANTEVIWESSNEEVATVNQKGTLSFHKPGTATIRVKSASTNHSDEIEITVHPKNSSIEILGDKEIIVNKNTETLLKVKINPDGVLPQKLNWTSNAGKDEEYDRDIIYFYTNSYEEYCEYEVCASSYNEIVFTARKAGKYTITVTTEDGLYSDSIVVNVVQGVTSFGLNPDTNNVLGSTLYIYMKESKYLDLNVKVYPEDATDKEIIYTSSDESIATVDKNGRVTAKRAGKVTINFKAKNYDVERDINILIFDNTVSTIIGDVDGDGIVDILDLVKLRRHVAGVEAIQ